MKGGCFGGLDRCGVNDFCILAGFLWGIAHLSLNCAGSYNSVRVDIHENWECNRNLEE